MSAEALKKLVTRRIFDLLKFEEIEVGKELTFTPAESIEEALAMLGNDSARLLNAVNRGLLAEAKKQLKSSTEDWKVLSEDGKSLTENFEGQPADTKKVNSLVITLAKTVFGYEKGLKPEEKKAKKDMAIAMIRSNDQIREGLAQSAALEDDDED